MAFEISAPGSQTIPAGGSVTFTVNPVPCRQGIVYWRPGTGLVRLASPSLMTGCGCVQPWNCCGMLQADYDVGFHANVQIPEGGTAGSVLSLGVAIDGVIDPDSIMQATPAAVGEPANIGTGIIVPVPWICRCSSIQIVNTSEVEVQINNPNLVIKFDRLNRR